MYTSIDALLTGTYSTYRNPLPISGMIGPPVVHLISISGMPLDPLDSNTATRLGLDRPHELLQTVFIGNPDILREDIIMVSGEPNSYQVVQVSEYYWKPELAEFIHVVVKERI